MSDWWGTAEYAAVSVAFVAGARYLYNYYNGALRLTLSPSMQQMPRCLQ